MSLPRRAQHIAKTLGHFRAARFLARREVTLEDALRILFNR